MLVVRLSVIVLLMVCGHGLRAAASPVDIGSRLELFVNGHLIERLENAELRLHSPIPREVVFVFDKPYEQAQSGYMTILRDGVQYRMYYLAGGDLGREYACVAFSADGIRWERPRLGLIEINGSTANNAIWTGKELCYDEAHNFSPFIDSSPQVRPDERYKAVSFRMIRDANSSDRSGLMAFASADGIHWRRLGDQPVITDGAFDTHNTAFWDEHNGQYVCYIRTARQGKKSIARATSADFLNWSKPQPLDFGDSPAEHLYTNGIVPYFRAPHLYLGFAGRFIPPTERNRVGEEQRETDGFSDAVFMSSRDGLHWDRTFMEAFIRPGTDPRNWGGAHGNMFPAWGILPAADHEISIYWADHYDNYPKKDLIPRLWRGTVRTDGFVSVNFPYRGGQMITRPLVFAGRHLLLNYATSAPGSVRVEIQDAAGTPVPGFTLDDAIAFWGDEIERVVAWKGGSNLTVLAGKPVRLRFVMNDADLYSIRFR